MKKNLIGMMAILLACATVMVSCKDKTGGSRPVKGTLEQKIGEDSVPQTVSSLLKEIEKTHGDERFELIMENEKCKVSVWGLMKCNDQQSSEGYGVTIFRRGIETDLEIRHGRMPKAFYDMTTASLWFAGGVMEGTGVDVEKLYLIQFDDSGKGKIMACIDPYDMQQELCKRISYSIEGQQITLYADNKPLTTVTNNTHDMGDFYEDPIWIGEQIQYLLSKKPTVLFEPGINFNTGKVLIYDDMPMIAATVDLTPEGFKVTDFRIVQENKE